METGGNEGCCFLLWRNPCSPDIMPPFLARLSPTGGEAQCDVSVSPHRKFLFFGVQVIRRYPLVGDAPAAGAQAGCRSPQERQVINYDTFYGSVFNPQDPEKRIRISDHRIRNIFRRPFAKNFSIFLCIAMPRSGTLPGGSPAGARATPCAAAGGGINDNKKGNPV